MKPEKEIDHSRELLSAIINSSPDRIHVMKAVRNGHGEIVDFRWLLMNKAAKKEYGDLTGEHWLRHYPGVLKEGIFETFKKVVENEESAEAEIHYNHEGLDVWAHQLVVKLDDGIVSTNRDISQRKKIENEIRQQAHFIQTITEISPDVVTVVELPSRKIVYSNRDTLKLLDFDVEEIINMSYDQRMDLFHPEDRPAIEAFYKRFPSLKDGENNTVQYRLRNKRGEWIYMFMRARVFSRDKDGHVAQALFITQDITERKMTEQQLQDGHRRMKEAQAAGQVGSFEWNLDTGKIVWSDELYRMHGLPTDFKITEENIFSLVHPDDQDFAMKNAAECLSGAGRVQFTVRMIKPDGEQRIASLSLQSFAGESGKISHVSGMVKDITEQKQAEEEILRLKDEIVKQAKEALRINEVRIRRQKEAFQSAMNGATLAASLNIMAWMVHEETKDEARTAFYIADADGARLHPVWGAGNMPESYLRDVDGFIIGEDSIACGLAVPTGRAVITTDVREDPLWKPWAYLADAYDYRGCWSFPIKTRDNKAIGTFTMYFRQPKEPTPDHLALADVVTQAAAIIISSHTDAAEREEVEEALRESARQLKELNDELEHRVKKRTNELIQLKIRQEKEKLNAMIFAQEQERTRIGEALHNGVAQLLYAVQSRLQLVNPKAPSDEQVLKTSIQILSDAIQDTRKISFQLMPPVLKDFGLAVALDTLLRRVFNDKFRVKMNVDLDGKLSEDLEISIYRIVQEAMNNILKHADATEASIEIYESRGAIRLKIKDNGKGFSPKAIGKDLKGIGLHTIKNRVRLLNGKIKLGSSEKGTVIEISIPLAGK